jgi:hypothetical protein
MNELWKIEIATTMPALAKALDQVQHLLTTFEEAELEINTPVVFSAKDYTIRLAPPDKQWEEP